MNEYRRKNYFFMNEYVQNNSIFMNECILCSEINVAS